MRLSNSNNFRICLSGSCRVVTHRQVTVGCLGKARREGRIVLTHHNLELLTGLRTLGTALAGNLRRLSSLGCLLLSAVLELRLELRNQSLHILNRSQAVGITLRYREQLGTERALEVSLALLLASQAITLVVEASQRALVTATARLLGRGGGVLSGHNGLGADGGVVEVGHFGFSLFLNCWFGFSFLELFGSSQFKLTSLKDYLQVMIFGCDVSECKRNILTDRK